MDREASRAPLLARFILASARHLRRRPQRPVMAASGRFALWPCHKRQSLTQLEIVTYLVMYTNDHNIKSINILAKSQCVSMQNPGITLL